MGDVDWFVATKSFKATTKQELDLHQGQLYTLKVRKPNKQWWSVQDENGKEGYVPNTYLDPVQMVRGRTIETFTSTDNDEELSVVAGCSLSVVVDYGDGWIKVRLDTGQIGRIPSWACEQRSASNIHELASLDDHNHTPTLASTDQESSVNSSSLNAVSDNVLDITLTPSQAEIIVGQMVRAIESYSNERNDVNVLRFETGDTFTVTALVNEHYLEVTANDNTRLDTSRLRRICQDASHCTREQQCKCTRPNPSNHS